MAFDEALADRVRAALTGELDVSERKMFGGLAFMVCGNMALGVIGDGLMVRVGKEDWVDALVRPHAREMDFTGRSMRGMVVVDSEGLEASSDLDAWIDSGLSYARSLPEK